MKFTVEDTSNYLDVGVYVASVYEWTKDEVNDKDVEKITFKDIETEKIHIETFWVNDKAMFRFSALAVACGYEIGAEVETEDLIGKTCVIHITKRTYDGKDYRSISRFEPAPKDNAPAEKSTDKYGDDPF